MFQLVIYSRMSFSFSKYTLCAKCRSVKVCTFFFFIKSFYKMLSRKLLLQIEVKTSACWQTTHSRSHNVLWSITRYNRKKIYHVGLNRQTWCKLNATFIFYVQRYTCDSWSMVHSIIHLDYFIFWTIMQFRKVIIPRSSKTARQLALQKEVRNSSPHIPLRVCSHQPHCSNIIVNGTLMNSHNAAALQRTTTHICCAKKCSRTHFCARTACYVWIGCSMHHTSTHDNTCPVLWCKYTLREKF